VTGLDCNELVELVTDYLDGALDAAETARIREHLAICDGCERYLEQFRDTIHLLAAQRSAHVTDDMREQLLSAFRSLPPPA
jgi:anti-sigma factor RsiW